MAEEVSPPDEPFDLERVRALMELMEKHGLTEVHLRRGSERWRLRRGGHETAGPPMMWSGGPSQMPTAFPTQPAAPAPPAAEAAREESLPAIKSPTVGTFYASPTPDDPPFVSAGSKVRPDTVVCIIEAMKVFNQIPAEVSGTIAEVLVKNGDSVEFGQPLFRVRPD